MAKKAVPASKKPEVKSAPARSAAPVASSPVRNSPVPKAGPKAGPKSAAPAPTKEIGYAEIAKRAYEIYASGQGGSESDNWYRAERELRGL
jgi:hypothetical protein